MDVSGKVALVTGGGRGIGRGIVLVLARNGADVVVADIDTDVARSTAAEVEAVGRRSLASRVDVTDRESVGAATEDALARFDRIDILVNNAGVVAAPGWEDRETPDEDDWDLTYEVNVKGVVWVTEAVAPQMVERRTGKIINISSVTGRLATLTSIPYGATKAGAINLTQAYALKLAPHNINVNCICPGLLWTPMWESIGARWLTDEDRSEGLSPRDIFDRIVKQRAPLGREQTPEDIGHLAAFLASDYAINITGQTINVSGGSHMN